MTFCEVGIYGERTQKEAFMREKRSEQEHPSGRLRTVLKMETLVVLDL